MTFLIVFFFSFKIYANTPPVLVEQIDCIEKCYINYRFDLRKEDIKTLIPTISVVCKTPPYAFPVQKWMLFDCIKKETCYIEAPTRSKRLVNHTCSSIKKAIEKANLKTIHF